MYYRAYRKPHRKDWMIEQFDSEAGCAYDYISEDSPVVKIFVSQEAAETYIRRKLLKIEDNGEKGEWLP